MPLSTAINPPEFDFDTKEPWAVDAYMMIPFEKSQILMPESAAVLGVQAFLKMTHLPYSVKQMHNAADVSPNGKLPVIKCGAYVVSEMEGIVQLAQAKGVSMSAHLSAAEKADLRAYMSLVHNVLGNAMLYFTWLDDQVYNDITRHRVGSVYNFPLKYLLPWSLRRKVLSQLTALKWGERQPEEVYREVETCLLALSERLGDSEYFFGASPTELDALVFGYLFTMITTRLPNPHQMGNLVKHNSNLIKFCQRLEREFFGSE